MTRRRANALTAAVAVACFVCSMQLECAAAQPMDGGWGNSSGRQHYRYSGTKTNGGLKWAVQVSYAASAIVDAHNAIYVGGANVTRLAPADGSVVWTTGLRSSYVLPTPALSARGYVYVPIAGALFALDGDNGGVVWVSSPSGAGKSHSPAVLSPDGALVYSCHDPGVWRAFDAMTGAVMAQYALNSEGCSQSSAAVSFCGALFVHGSQQKSAIVALSPMLEAQWNFRLNANSSFVSAPVLNAAKDTLFVAAVRSGVYALNATTGRQLWFTPLGSVYFSPALSTDSTLLFAAASDRNTLVALNAADGAIVWQINTVGDPSGAVVGTDGTVYWGAWSNGGTVAVEPSTGARLCNVTSGWAQYPWSTGPDGTVYIINHRELQAYRAVPTGCM